MAELRNPTIQNNHPGSGQKHRWHLSHWSGTLLVGLLATLLSPGVFAQDLPASPQSAEGAVTASPVALPEAVQAQMQAGGNALRQGRYPDALRAFSQVIRQAPTYAPAFFLRGQTYQALQQNEQALKDFNRAVKLDPTNAEAIATRNALQRSYAAELMDRAMRFWNGQQNEQALQTLSRAIEINPDSVEALMRRGELYQSNGDYGAAVQDFTQVLSLDASQMSARLARGIAYTWMERYPEALADLNQAIEQDPSDFWVWIGRGRLYLAQKQYPQALEDFQQAGKLNSQVAIPFIEQAETYRWLNRPQDALQALNRAIQLEPDNVWAIASRGDLYFYDLANHRAARADVERGLILAPADANLLTLRGSIAMMAGNYHGAMLDFKAALEVDPQNPAALNNRSELWLLQKEYDWALASLNEAIALNPEDTWAQYLRVLTYYAQGQKAKADAALPDLLAQAQQSSSQPDNVWRGTINLALFNLLADRPDQASELYRNAIAGAPPDILREASHDLSTFLTVFPKHTQALALRQLLQAKLPKSRPS